MKYKMSLLSFVLLAFVVNILLDNTEASTVICFTINSQNISKTFEFEKVTYAEARESLKLTASDSFIYHDHLIYQSSEKKWLVQNDECNVVLNQSEGFPIDVCIVNDQCKTITIDHNAKVNDLRDKLFALLPEYYSSEYCADIVFLDDRRREIQRSDEISIPYYHIERKGKITAYNRFIDNTNELNITTTSKSHVVLVNMAIPLSNLRYWIMKPNDCPNLKDKLNLPFKPFFPNAKGDLAPNWLARDKRVRLNEVPSSSLRGTHLVAPYDKEPLLPIYSHAYNVEESKIQKLLYVDTSVDVIAFTGLHTQEFDENQLTLIVSPYEREIVNTLMMLKDVRSTSRRAVSWHNVVLSANNTRVTVRAKWHNHEPGSAYFCTLYSFRSGYEKHILYDYMSREPECFFDKIYDKESQNTHDLLLNREELVGEDHSKFRYELGVTLYPYPRNAMTNCARRKRSVAADTIVGQPGPNGDTTMVGAGKIDEDGYPYKGCIKMKDVQNSEKNKRSLRFNVFIFKSQEIADKIFNDIPAKNIKHLSS